MRNAVHLLFRLRKKFQNPGLRPPRGAYHLFDKKGSHPMGFFGLVRQHAIKIEQVFHPVFGCSESFSDRQES
jgi:hypothetical protein